MASLEDVIGQAIRWEEYAYQFYKSASEKIDVIPVKRLFEKLAREELKHKSLLENLDLTSFSHLTCGLDHFNLIDDLQTFNSENIKNIMHIIEFAMDKEQKAEKRYMHLGAEVEGKKLKKIFNTLAISESCHHSLLRVEYERLQQKGR